MFRWTPYAFVRFFLFFAAGIVAGFYFPDIPGYTGAVASLALFALAYLLIFFIIPKSHVFSGVAASTILVLGGYVHSLQADHARRDNHLVNASDSIIGYTATLESLPERSTRSWKHIANVSRIKTREGWREAAGKMMLYVAADTLIEPFPFGTELIVMGTPARIEPPRNPSQFDYRRFLAHKNIFHQQFVTRHQVTLTGSVPAKSVGYLINHLRRRAIAVFDQLLDDDDHKGIASALVLGYREGIDRDISNSFSVAGAMHILAVSGLHVGLVYAVVLFMLRPFARVRHGKWIIACSSLISLWAYAFLTGLSPSALRAAAMFSFFAIAEPWRKSTQPLNTLAASAFFMLLYDPHLLLSVGFQLSYLAVFGILYGYRRLVMVWEAPTWLLDKVWKMTCVSISAQLATLPVSILYFHQIPTYALVANLAVIPLAFIILITGLLVLAVSWNFSLASIVAYVFSLQLEALLKTVSFIENLPYSSMKNLFMTPLQCVLMFALGFSIVLLFEVRKFKWNYVIVICALLFSVTLWEQEIRWRNQEKLVVYNVPGCSVIDFMDGRSVVSFADSAAMINPDKLEFYVTECRLAHGISMRLASDRVPFWREVPGGSLIRWKGLTLLHLKVPGLYPEHPDSVDYVILSHNAVKQMEEIASRIRARQWIVDASNHTRLIERLTREANTKNLNLHATAVDGAVEITL